MKKRRQFTEEFKQEAANQLFESVLHYLSVVFIIFWLFVVGALCNIEQP